MKMLAFFILSVFNFPSNALSTSNVEEGKKSLNNPPQHITVSYTLSMKIDEEKLKNFPEEMKKHIKEKLGGDKAFVLKATAEESIFMLEEEVKIADIVSEKTQVGEVTKKVVSSEVSYSNYYKDFLAGKMIQQRFFRGETYLIEDTIRDFEWNIDSELVEINGYQCRAAISTSNGKSIKVWFTEDIAIADGPMTYNGLPGLILKVETPDLEIFATKIAFSDTSAIQAFTEGKKISKEAMQKIINDSKNSEDFDRRDGNKRESFRVLRSN